MGNIICDCVTLAFVCWSFDDDDDDDDRYSCTKKECLSFVFPGQIGKYGVDILTKSRVKQPVRFIEHNDG
eukprot:12419269-Ditylum_brightwellii.AAC.1